LKGMRSASDPEELWNLARRLQSEGCRGILLSGGCDLEGVVPLAPFCGALARIRNDLGFKTAVHTKLLDDATARALANGNPDVVMLDVVGADETLREMFNLPRKTVADITRTLDLAREHRLSIAPHIVVGAHGGQFRGEYKALAMLRGQPMKSLVIVLLMPLDGCRTEGFVSPNIEDIRRFFRTARHEFPDTPLLLGCARPMGSIQREIDFAALDSGFDGIAYPAEGAVARARDLGLRPIFSEYCCALMV
ncbi:MAG: radical SAM protein, partial [Candidatus Sumerlaeota bacterium]|nr:radical SAM protein [Candidatus Sumerlaeota bacterium]